MQHVIDHIESDLPLPDELKQYLVEMLTEMIPKVRDRRGFREYGYAAWENAVSVKEAMHDGHAKSLEEAFAYVAAQSAINGQKPESEETIKKHWQRFNRHAKTDELPPLEMLGDLSKK